MALSPCPTCSRHVHVNSCSCMHCGATLKVCSSRSKLATVAGVALLGLAGCGDKDDTGESASPQPDYGVADSGMMAEAPQEVPTTEQALPAAAPAAAAAEGN